MTWQIFGLSGYLSVLLSMAALALWLLYWVKPKRWFVNVSFLLVLLAFLMARMHSGGYIARVEIDPAIKLAELEARQKAKEQALIKSRSDEVAQIRFAEDSQGDFLDTAGMDEADMKYLKAISEEETPDWKKTKKERGSAAVEDDSLESLIDGEEKNKGADVSELEEEQKTEPILLSEAAVVLANKLDLWNLRLSKYLLWAAILMLIVDYLRRANLYREASRPIPLPSSWLIPFSPLAVVHDGQITTRRTMPEELKWLTLRGDAFIYFCDRPNQAEAALQTLAKYQSWPLKLDLIRVDDSPGLNSAFIFESVWYGRSSFIVDRPEDAEEIIKCFIERLKKRRETKAKTAQSVHLVWDLEQPFPESDLEEFRQYAEAAGCSLWINSRRY